MKPLPGEFVSEHKAFDLAVRVPVFRKTRIEELRKAIRTQTIMVFFGVLCAVAYYLFLRDSPNARVFLSAMNLMAAFVSLGRAMRGYSEAKILQMLEIQDRIAASQTPAP